MERHIDSLIDDKSGIPHYYVVISHTIDIQITQLLIPLLWPVFNHKSQTVSVMAKHIHSEVDDNSGIPHYYVVIS